jgi:hypothetical protein
MNKANKRKTAFNSSEKAYGGYSTHSLPTKNAENLPKYVEDKVKYFEEEKGYEPEKSWPVAWSIYCKYKEPNSPHCKKEPSEYFPGRSKKASLQRIADAKIDKAFKEVFSPLISELKDLGHEEIAFTLAKQDLKKVDKLLSELPEESRIYFKQSVLRLNSLLSNKLLNG